MLNSLARKINLQPGEEIRLIMRRSLFAWFGQEIIIFFLIASPLFFMYPLFKVGIYGVIVFFIILLIGIICLIKVSLSYYFTVFVLTSNRMIDIERKGYTKTYLAEILYNKIQNITSEKIGFFDSVFGLGSIYINLTDGNSKIKLSKVKDFERVVGNIAFHQDLYSKNKRKQTEQKALRLLQKIKKRVGDQEFSRLISD